MSKDDLREAMHDEAMRRLRAAGWSNFEVGSTFADDEEEVYVLSLLLEEHPFSGGLEVEIIGSSVAEVLDRLEQRLHAIGSPGPTP